MPVMSASVELIAARFGDEVEVTDTRKFGRVVALHHHHFLVVVDVDARQACTVACVAVDSLLHLSCGLTGNLDAIDSAGTLHQRKSCHDHLRIATVSNKRSTVKALLGEG